MSRQLNKKYQYNESFSERAFKLALLGLTDREIADALGIPLLTMEKWKANKYKADTSAFQKALDLGRQTANAEVAHSLYRQALGYTIEEEQAFVYKGEIMKTKVKKFIHPNATATLFYLKNRTKQNEHPFSDINKHEITGKNGGPIQMQDIDDIDISDLSDEELKLLQQIQTKTKSKE